MMPWHSAKKILCIRADNIGDVLMAQPALRALKVAVPDRSVTLLTSTVGAAIAPFIPEIASVIRTDVPWISARSHASDTEMQRLVEQLRAEAFDAAVIFTNFSQTSAPAALLCYVSGIPRRLAYSRENIYRLLTDWVPDREPFVPIRHQVERNLVLAARAGAMATDYRLSLTVSFSSLVRMKHTLQKAGVQTRKPWVVVHPGVQDKKRQYPLHKLRQVLERLEGDGFQVVLTGIASDVRAERFLMDRRGGRTVSFIHALSLEEFIALIRLAPVVLSNNTGTIHIAAAVQTPVVVLYARVNPEHTPWNVVQKVMYFNALRLPRAPILTYAAPHDQVPALTPEDIEKAVVELYAGKPGEN